MYIALSEAFKSCHAHHALHPKTNQQRCQYSSTVIETHIARNPLGALQQCDVAY